MPVGTAITIVAAMKVGPRVDAQPHRVHVVRPDDEADEANRDHGIGHAEIAEDRLAREGRTRWLTMPKPGRIMM